MNIVLIGQKLENVKYLLSKGAKLTSIDKEGQLVLQVIINKAPAAMEEFNKRLDEGIVMSESGCHIDLDFSMIQEESASSEMSLFQILSESPFKYTIEHPLIQTYLHDKFSQLKYIFIIALLLPHLIFSGKLLLIKTI